MDEARHTSDRKGHVLLAGGGSAGHVFPGLAVGAALVDRGWRVSWLGRPAGMERDLVSRQEIEYHGLPARALVGRGLAAKAMALTTTGFSALRAAALVRRQKVDAVLGTGGYVCAPAFLGARLARRPAFLLEPNARAGTANRLLARWSDEVFLGFPETAVEIGTVAEKCRHTGIPVRSEFFRDSSLPPLPPRLLVLGGSQGAREINELLPPVVERLAVELGDLEVLHQTGAAHAESVQRDYAGRDLGHARVRVEAFLEDVASAMVGAHLIVSRAGALTLAEICAAGRGSVLLPLTIAAGHQKDNAERLVAADAARLVADQANDPAARTEATADLLMSLLGQSARLAAMGAAARSLARPDAAAEIAATIVERVDGIVRVDRDVRTNSESAPPRRGNG